MKGKSPAIPYDFIPPTVTHYFMKIQILLILILFGLISCNSNQANKIERKGEPTIYSVQDDDIEMNNMIKTAKQTLSKFNEALQSKNPNFGYFDAIKKYCE